MFKKSNPRTSKKTVATKSSRSKPKSKPRGRLRFPVLSRRMQLLAFGLSFGLFGAAFLLLTRAATSPENCKSLSSTGNNVKICVAALPTYSSLRATAEHVAADTNSTLSSATVWFELCSPQTLKCTAMDSSNQIRLYTTSQPRYQHLYTQGTRFLLGAVYRTCFSMTNKAGWSLNHECTPMLTYGNSVSNTPKVFTGTTQTTSARVSTSSYPTSECSSPPIRKPDGSNYQCTFDEEFNGTSLDKTKWTPLTAAATGVGQGRDCFVDWPNNISVSGGTLNLTSRKELSPFTCTGRKLAPTDPAIVSSGNVTTGKKFSQQYGRVEVRAKIPDVQTKVPGLMQSLWLWPDNPSEQNPANAPWPAGGEIDIVEMFSAGPDRAIPYIHYVPDPADPNVTNPYCYIDRSQFHTYVLTWTADTIRIDIDGYNCVLDRPRPKSPQVAPQPFNKTFYINLSSGLGVRGSNNDYVEGTTPLPATTQIDYVRVWK